MSGLCLCGLTMHMWCLSVRGNKDKYPELAQKVQMPVQTPHFCENSYGLCKQRLNSVSVLECCVFQIIAFNWWIQVMVIVIGNDDGDDDGHGEWWWPRWLCCPEHNTLEQLRIMYCSICNATDEPAMALLALACTNAAFPSSIHFARVHNEHKAAMLASHKQTRRQHQWGGLKVSTLRQKWPFSCAECSLSTRSFKLKVLEEAMPVWAFMCTKACFPTHNLVNKQFFSQHCA